MGPTAFLLLLIALLLWLLAGRLRRASGLPSGKVVYTDTRAWGRVEKPLYSRRLGLTGRPDYLVRQGGHLLPVEVKAGPAPAAGPRASHVYQLAAYCLLVHAAYGRRPPSGLVKYSDRTLAVEFTPELERSVIDLLADMRADGEAEAVGRSHDSAARCRACGFVSVCGESLG